MPTIFLKTVSIVRWATVDQSFSCIEFVKTLDLVGTVVLRRQTERFGFMRRFVSLVTTQPAAVAIAPSKRGRRSGFDDRDNPPSWPSSARHAAARPRRLESFPSLVQAKLRLRPHRPRSTRPLSQKGSRLKVYVFIAFLESIEFLQHDDGNDYIVFLEVLDAIRIVQDDIRINHKELGLGLKHAGMDPSVITFSISTAANFNDPWMYGPIVRQWLEVSSGHPIRLLRGDV